MWNWETDDGRGLRRAIEYFVGQLEETSGNPFQADRSGELYFTLRAASSVYHNPDYDELPGKIYKDPLVDEITQIIISPHSH